MTGRSPRKPLRISSAIVIALVALVVGARYAVLPSVARTLVDKELDSLSGYRGKVAEVRLHLLRRSVSLQGIRIEKQDPKGKYDPFLNAKSLDIHVSLRHLIRREMLAALRLNEPSVYLTTEPAPNPAKPSSSPQQVQAKVSKELRDQLPFKISSLKIRDGEIHYVDATKPPITDLRATHVNASVDNLTNSRKLSNTLFATFDVNALMMDSGKTHLSGTFNPLKEPPEFKLNVSVKSLDISKLDPLLAQQKNVHVKKGNLDLAAEVATKDNNVVGYIKPVVTDLQVSDLKQDMKKGAGHALKEQALNLAANVAKSHKHDEQAAQIPFQGKLDQPKVSVGAAINSTLRNIFVQALTPNLEHSATLAQAGK